MAASGCPKMPKTPHSSLNLSTWVVPCSRSATASFYAAPSPRHTSCSMRAVSRPALFGFADARLSRHAARRPSIADPRSGPPVVPMCARRHAALGRQPQQRRPDPRRATPTRRHATPTRRRASPHASATRRPGTDAPAHRRRRRCRRCRSALGQRHREAAVGAVVRRLRAARAGGRRPAARCSARSRVEVERRRRAADQAVDASSGTRCRRARRALAEQDDRVAARVGTSAARRGVASSISPTTPMTGVG